MDEEILSCQFLAQSKKYGTGYENRINNCERVDYYNLTICRTFSSLEDNPNSSNK